MIKQIALPDISCTSCGAKVSIFVCIFKEGKLMIYYSPENCSHEKLLLGRRMGEVTFDDIKTIFSNLKINSEFIGEISRCEKKLLESL